MKFILVQETGIQTVKISGTDNFAVSIFFYLFIEIIAVFFIYIETYLNILINIETRLEVISVI